MSKLLIVLVIVALSGIVLCLEDKNQGRSHKTDKKWIAYKNKHLGKLRSFKTDKDEANGFKNFIEADKVIEEINAKYAKGEVDFQLEHNFMSGATDAQKKGFTGLKFWFKDDLKSKRAVATFTYDSSIVAKIPAAKDWTSEWKPYARDQNTIAGFKPVSCGSCWAFATCAALEAHFYIKSKQRIDCAPQQMVSCDNKNGGCDGGDYRLALDYASKNPITIEPFYAYIGAKGSCSAVSKARQYLSSVSYQMIPSGSIEALKVALATSGPVLTCINGDAPEFQNYKFTPTSGPLVMNDNYACTHAILAVGYGKDKNNNDYIRIKNSWGRRWGDNGLANVSVKTAKGQVYFPMFQLNVLPVIADTARQGTLNPIIETTTSPFNGPCNDNKFGSKFCAANAGASKENCEINFTVKADKSYQFREVCPLTCGLCK